MRRDSLVDLPAVLSSEQPRTDARYVMGVDGGATKTLAAVLDLRAQGTGEKLLHLGHGGPSNEDAVGARGGRRGAAGSGRRGARAGGHRGGGAGRGGAGDRGTDTEDVERNVRAARTDAWIVVNDVVAAWATATGGGPGVAAIAGTGSNVFGVNLDRGETRAVARRRLGPSARRRGVGLLAGRAVDQGGAARPRGVGAADGDDGGGARVLRRAEHRGGGRARVLQAADQGRDRGVRDRNGEAGGAGRRGCAWAVRAWGARARRAGRSGHPRDGARRARCERRGA